MPAALRSPSRRRVIGGLVHRFGAITSARAIGLVAMLVQLPLLTSSLTPAQYALVAAAIASGGYVSFASVEPAALAFQRFPGQDSGREAYARAQLQLLVGASVVTAGIVAVGFALGAGEICFAAAGWGVGLAWLRLVSTAWLMWDAPWKYTVCIAASTLVRTLGLCGFVVAGARPELAVGVAGLLSAASTVLLRPRLRSARPALRTSHPWLGVSLAVSSLAVAALQGIDKVVLPLVADGNAAGKYAAMSNLSAYSLGALLSIVSAAVFTPILRLWESGDQRSAIRYLRSATTGALGISALASSLVLLGGPDVIVHLVEAEYVDVSVLAALMAGVGLMVSGQFNAYLYQFRLATTALQVRSWLAAVVAIVLLLVGGRVAGEHGAAAAMVAGFAVYSLGLQIGSRSGWVNLLATGCVATLGVAAIAGAHHVTVGVAGLGLAAVLLVPVVRSMLRAAASDARRGPGTVETESGRVCP